MSTLQEIESAIANLPVPEVDELVTWLRRHHSERGLPPKLDVWLEQAKGAALPGVTTADVMAITRSE